MTINAIVTNEDTPDQVVNEFAQDAMEAFLYNHSFTKYDDLAIRAKTTTSTEIAAQTAPKPSTSHIPVQYQRYSKVFSEEASHCLPRHQAWDHAIELKLGASMKNCSIYQLMPKESSALSKYISEHLRKGYIRPSKSPMASPFFFVDKKDGKLQPVQDYRALNDITIKNTAPLPLIPELIDKLHSARYFTKLDIWWGYNNIHIWEGDEHKAAFKTPLGLFEPTVMTFSLCNVPATFQTFMNNIFEDMVVGGQVVVYLDDILIFAKEPQLLNKLTHKVLSRLEKCDLYLKPEKCSFMQTSIEYLGVILMEGQVQMDHTRIAGIVNWPVPWTVKQGQAFLGFWNFYRHFIKDFSHIACPLFNLTKKGVPFVWGPDQAHAFKQLIWIFTTAPVLALPDHSQPFHLITDASDFATGAILEQPDALNHWHPIVYHSKSLLPAECNYEIHDKELLAIIHALNIFWHYLEGCNDTMEIWLDHGNLVYFSTKQKLMRRQAQWALFLSRFQFTIIHKPSTQNKSDVLSWCPDHKEGIVNEENECVLLDMKFIQFNQWQSWY